MSRIMQTYPDLIRDKPDFVCNKVDMQEFETADDMASCAYLELGYAHTLGEFDLGDGKAAYYRVVASKGEDSVVCKNGYFANLLFYDEYDGGAVKKLQADLAATNEELAKTNESLAGTKKDLGTVKEDLGKVKEDVSVLDKRTSDKVAVFMGDSWTVGTQGGDVSVYKYTDYIAASGVLGEVHNIAVGGSGFESSSGLTFMKQAQQAKADYPDADVICLLGGVNDDSNDVTAAADSLFGYLRENWPNADIYYCANMNRNSLIANFNAAYDRYAAAKRHGVVVFEGLPAILRNMDDYYTPEKWHMYTQAYKYIATVFIAMIKGVTPPLPRYTNKPSSAFTPTKVSVTQWVKTRCGDMCTNLLELTATSSATTQDVIGKMDIEFIPPIADNGSARCQMNVSRGAENLVSYALISHEGNVTPAMALESGDVVHLLFSYPQTSSLFTNSGFLYVENSIDSL